jgi:hypothetical protein
MIHKIKSSNKLQLATEVLTGQQWEDLYLPNVFLILPSFTRVPLFHLCPLDSLVD